MVHSVLSGFPSKSISMRHKYFNIIFIASIRHDSSGDRYTLDRRKKNSSKLTMPSTLYSNALKTLNLKTYIFQKLLCLYYISSYDRKSEHPSSNKKSCVKIFAKNKAIQKYFSINCYKFCYDKKKKTLVGVKVQEPCYFHFSHVNDLGYNKQLFSIAYLFDMVFSFISLLIFIYTAKISYRT